MRQAIQLRRLGVRTVTNRQLHGDQRYGMVFQHDDFKAIRQHLVDKFCFRRAYRLRRRGCSRVPAVFARRGAACNDAGGAPTNCAAGAKKEPSSKRIRRERFKENSINKFISEAQTIRGQCHNLPAVVPRLPSTPFDVPERGLDVRRTISLSQPL